MGKQHGAGLTELLISLALASIILLALTQHYLSIKQNYQRMQIELNDGSDLQSVVDLMRERVQKAGFTSCGNIEQLKTIDQRDGRPLLALDVRNDYLAINHMSELFSLISVQSNTELFMAHRDGLRQLGDRPIVIADCYHAEVQAHAWITPTRDGERVTLYQPLAFAYHSPVYMGEWVQSSFFIKGGASLYYQHDRADELTHLVHRLLVRLQRYPNGVVAAISLGLRDSRAVAFDAWVRTR